MTPRAPWVLRHLVRVASLAWRVLRAALGVVFGSWRSVAAAAVVLACGVGAIAGMQAHRIQQLEAEVACAALVPSVWPELAYELEQPGDGGCGAEPIAEVIDCFVGSHSGRTRNPLDAAQDAFVASGPIVPCQVLVVPLDEYATRPYEPWAYGVRLVQAERGHDRATSIRRDDVEATHERPWRRTRGPR